VWELFRTPANNEEHLDGGTSIAAATHFADLGDLPLVALTHTVSPLAGSLDERTVATQEAAWTSGQRAFAALSARGVVRPVPGASHFIQDDAPAAVIDAVSAMVRAGAG
jgi:hypothetical protein